MDEGRSGGGRAEGRKEKGKEKRPWDNLSQRITFVHTSKTYLRTKTRQNATSRTGEKILEEKA